MRNNLRRLALVLASLAALIVLASVAGSAQATSVRPAHARAHTHGVAARTHTVASHRVTRHVGVAARVGGSEDPGTQAGEAASSEPDTDAAAQASACGAAGIDPNGSNVQFDDQTGTCSLDTGGNTNQ